MVHENKYKINEERREEKFKYVKGLDEKLEKNFQKNLEKNNNSKQNNKLKQAWTHDEHKNKIIEIIKDDYYEEENGQEYEEKWMTYEKRKKENPHFKRNPHLGQVLLLGVLSILLINPSNAIVIHQVLYDPVTSETGGEAVELYNEQNTSIDISGWIIKTKSSETDATIPSATILLPQEYYLLADAGWNASKDDPRWREADYEEAITLTNTNAGVALKNGSEVGDIVIDAVGWGSIIDPELFEGTPANGTRQGKSLLRINNTGNNAVDFIEADADFSQRPDAAQRIDIILPVSESSAGSYIRSITMSDDLPASGNQIFPMAGSERILQIRVNATDNTTSLSGELEKEQEIVEFDFLRGSSGIWTANTTMDFFDRPGNYTVQISAGSEIRDISFEYLSLLAIGIDADELRLPQSRPGTSVILEGDDDEATQDAVTLKNIGNADLDIGLSATPLAKGSALIPASSFTCSLDNDFSSSLSRELDESIQVINRALQPAQTSPLGVRVAIPLSTGLGTFSGSIVIMAIGAQ